MLDRPSTGRAALQQFPPRFRDPQREAEFLAQQLPASVPLIRVALGVGLAIYVAFGLVDPLVYEARLQEIYLSRFGVGAPAIVAALALTCSRLFADWHQAILCAAVTIVGATIVFQVLLDPAHSYYVGLILLMFFAYLFLRIHYLLATGVCVGLVLACTGLVALSGAAVTAAHVTHASFLAGGFLVASLIAYVYEITLRREYLQRHHIEVQQSQLHALAYHDDTTGLANRHLFRDRLGERLAHAARGGESIAVAVLGIERLREISDMYGRSGGDELLRAVGAQLQRAAPAGTTVARLEAGDFALDLGPLDHRDDLVRHVEPLHGVLAHPVTIAGDAVSVRGRIGLSLFPDHGREPDQLIQAATTAMGAARHAPGSWRLYSGNMSTRVAERLQLEHELREASRRREFLLHYQPQVDVQTAELVGVEALLRWQHPQRGLLTPAEFLSMLEDTGLMGTVGHWTIDAALAQYRQWLRCAGRAWPIAINLSPRQVHDEDLVARIDRALAAEPVGGQALRIELTETAAMIDPEHTARTLQQLRERGIESALDDFGKGYSSLSQLRQLPVSTIKIDKAFLAGLPDHADNRALVDTIVTMAHHLGKAVLAEGVASEAQHRYLAAIGCDYAQGELFGMPLAPANIGPTLPGTGRAAPAGGWNR